MCFVANFSLLERIKELYRIINQLYLYFFLNGVVVYICFV